MADESLYPIFCSIAVVVLKQVNTIVSEPYMVSVTACLPPCVPGRALLFDIADYDWVYELTQCYVCVPAG